MKIVEGWPLPMGVTITGDRVNFSVAAPGEKECRLLLYRAGELEPFEQIPMSESLGEVRYLALEGSDITRYEYNYQVDGHVVVDPYAKALSGRSIWGRKRDIESHEVRGILHPHPYDWEGDRPLKTPFCETIAYSLHIRGFTKNSTSKVEHRGTFQGVIEKIPYMKELGINQIHCMPVYDFEECLSYTNYWGYGAGYFFAPKSAYASAGDGVRELKDMVKACHRAGIEVVLEMPFTEHIAGRMILECLRYYMMEFHVDGFILNPAVAPMAEIAKDPILKDTKLLRHDLGFQTVMRRFLKGDEGMVGDVIYWISHVSKEEETYNYIANHNGFTLNDAVSYDGKHNEKNGENNQDGPDYNYSWNCGAEGSTRKKAVLALRRRQRMNAFFLVLLAQGTPCILAGDEFGNTQMGNNNVYCQDNQTAWLDWKKLEKERELFRFVKGLIAVRKSHPVLFPEEELKGMDRMSCGVPDVSYHGENAWQIPSEVASRQLGVYYCSAKAGREDCFVAYNMHWLKHTFALPALPKGRKWYMKASTEDGILDEEVLLENQRTVELDERTVMLAIGKQAE